MIKHFNGKAVCVSSLLTTIYPSLRSLQSLVQNCLQQSLSSARCDVTKGRDDFSKLKQSMDFSRKLKSEG